MKRQFILTGCLLSLTFVSTASAAGSWKVAVDIWNSDLAAPAPPEKK